MPDDEASEFIGSQSSSPLKSTCKVNSHLPQLSRSPPKRSPLLTPSWMRLLKVCSSFFFNR